MSIKKMLFWFTVALMAFRGVPAEAAKNLHHFPVSSETRRIAAECRSQPTDELRESLRKHVERDFDRYVAEQRRKLKSGKRYRIHRHKLEQLLRERDRRVKEMVDRLLRNAPETEVKASGDTD